jgi:phage terminase large subunit
VPHILDPRHYQIDFLRAVREDRNVFSVIHRRAGKDTISIQALLLRGLKRVGTHVYLLPLVQQSRAVVWSGMTGTGLPFIKYIPEALIEYKNDARMEIRLINGSRLVFGGSNNYDGLMGTNPVTVIYSEYSLHHPMARQYLSPILIENGGVEILQMTPRGMNHGYETYMEVKDNPNYLVQHLGVDQTFKVDGTPVITKEQIEDAKRRGMSEEMVRQEFYVDFNVGNVGAYFTREVADMEREGRIGIVKPNPNLPLHSVWDLGGTDATAGWLFQVEGNYINLVALLHDSGKGLKYYLDWAEKLRVEFQCHWGSHFGPHDITQKHQSWEQAESRLMLARKAGWHFQVTPKLDIEDGIEAMRYVLPKIRIDKSRCQLGLRALKEYQREYNESKACFDQKPLHNWASHIIDALRYLSVNYKRLFDVPVPQHKYSYDDAPLTY